MSNLSPPPIIHQVIDNDGFATVPWTLFFNNLYEGDTGTSWSPTFENLTEVGTPTITGSYRFISQELVFFRVRIVPATSTTSAAGSTAINNFPLQIAQDGIVFAVSGLTGSASGMVSQSDQKIYTPAWAAVTVPLTIIGFAEVV